ncbi:glyoxalase [Microbacterium protaetiae]|uniref:Glyoxalase n=1 Tax=Microbacterium protaetiae TaxID=2509458 RepID=A0A4V0YDF8_9MICO|nr:VOC family protein [Microbacterium protaetiae]QAY60561.1 glyoxalase [Microbacterium protaetiae]
MSGFHHVELWVTDDETTWAEWSWLLERVGFRLAETWPGGRSWDAGHGYLVLTTSPNLQPVPHDRRRPGMNHLAFQAGSRAHVDAIMAAACAHGWTALYQERYPHAGGPDHYAGWLENSAGFKVEVVAS